MFGSGDMKFFEKVALIYFFEKERFSAFLAENKNNFKGIGMLGDFRNED